MNHSTYDFKGHVESNGSTNVGGSYRVSCHIRALGGFDGQFGVGYIRRDDLIFNDIALVAIDFVPVFGPHYIWTWESRDLGSQGPRFLHD